MTSEYSPIKLSGNVQSSTPVHKKSHTEYKDDTSDDGLESDDEFTVRTLPDVYVEVTEGKVSENSKTPGRKIYKKAHYCQFCNARQQQIVRHCKLIHSHAPEVKKIIEAGISNTFYPTYFKALEALCNMKCDY